MRVLSKSRSPGSSATCRGLSHYAVSCWGGVKMWRVSEWAPEATALLSPLWLQQDMQPMKLSIMPRLPFNNRRGKAGPVHPKQQSTVDALTSA